MAILKGRLLFSQSEQFKKLLNDLLIISQFTWSK